MALVVEINSVDVTNICVDGSWTRRLNRPSQAQVRMPTDQISASAPSPGSRLKITNNGTIVFHGMILLMETDQGEDTGYVTCNASDPMELWQWRPVRDDDCDFSAPEIIEDYGTGPQIIEAALINSDYCGDGSAADCEGPLFLDLGTFETNGCDLTGAPTDWPMTIAQLSSLLISTGCLDLVITPTDPGAGVMGTVDGYNGDFGTNLSTSVVFEYGTGAFNIRRFRRSQDMTAMANKLWYYIGPRVGTAEDPKGDQHWCFNVVSTDPCLPDPIPNGELLATLQFRRLLAQSTYGVRMDIQIFDGFDGCEKEPGTPPPCTIPTRALWRSRWESESWIRSAPRDLVHITPTRETEIGTFDIGDIVGVEIPILSVSAAQRVYAYTISWDSDGVLALSELQTSDTADG